MSSNLIKIFTDGSSRGNPGPGGWGAIVIFENKDSKDETAVMELGGRESHTTNNRMEIIAVIEALSCVKNNNLENPKIVIHTDSSYLINGITKWVYGWKKNGWVNSQKEAVLNRDLWEQLLLLVSGGDIDWVYVGGHVGVLGNERCDEIATGFADNNSVSLYKGLLVNYSIKNILDISENLSYMEKKKNLNKHSKAKAYSYLSLIDGKIERYSSWVECEKRVKGVKGAKYKKTISKEDEMSIIKSWTS